MSLQIWSAVAVIVIGYLVAMLYQTRHWDRRIDDLRSEVNHRFDDLKEWIRAEFRRLDERIDHLAGLVERLDARFDKLEARFEQPTAKG